MSVEQINKRHSTPKNSKNKAKKMKSAVHSSRPPKMDEKKRASKKPIHRDQKRRSTKQNSSKKNTKRIPKKKTIPRKKHWHDRMKRTLVEVGVSFVLLGIVLYALSFFTFSMVKVEGYSMVPTLNNGEWILVNKLAKIRRHKLILYKDPESKETSVRRIIGLPGERISYRDDQLYINDKEVYERYLDAEVKRAKESNSLYTADWYLETDYIPKGKYIILGDNRPYATDSREYGYIDEKEIIGIVEMRVFPIHQIKQF